MKKGIVLLTSLFFITILSLLFMENLKSTNTLVEEINDDLTSAQMMISVMNYKEEVGKILKEHKKDLDLILPLEVPLSMKGVSAMVSLSAYSNKLYDINVILGKDVAKKKELRAFFESNGADYGAFSFFLKNYMKEISKIQGYKQINQIVTAYKNDTQRTGIDEVISDLGYRDIVSPNTQTQENTLNEEIKKEINSVLCILSFDIKGKQYSSRFIYDLNTTNKVNDFELTFK